MDAPRGQQLSPAQTPEDRGLGVLGNEGTERLESLVEGITAVGLPVEPGITI